MAEGIRESKLQQLDTHLFYWLNKWSKDPIKHASVWISKTGDGPCYLAIGILLWWFGEITGERFFFSALMAYAFELPIYLILKNLIKRHRPFNKLTAFRSHISPSDKFSMPSGHTAAAFLFATLIMTFYPTFSQIAFCWASLVGISRVFLGVHFPGDVVVGATLGVVSALLGIDIVSGFYSEMYSEIHSGI
ncbi:phosphatase PAP2 family protein [Psychrosphaera ytuae]|uniref:undecaprenyl-diphosphate phosphatase n=1 Tax=Psychrosphaera ytuae TaxID=2820710 RepID=A0A975D969_9GAMM|nr:phosphatase PAP2 family protein [Psychrosphaera ytuae]QTH62599.1 phosphatase PAP2 family protein [Psychrosphaera ytuae]